MSMFTPSKFAAFICLAIVSSPLWSHPGVDDLIHRLSHMIEHKPERYELYIRRGLAYSDNAQYQLALADYRKAAALSSPEALDHDVGVVYYRMGELEQALRHFDAFLAQAPKSYPSYEYRARVKRDMGDYHGAIADLTQYFRLNDSPNPGHYVSAADMLLELEANGPESALQLLDEGLEKIGVVPQLQRKAIAIERARGRKDLALERLQTLESVLSSSPSWQLDMAELLIDSKRHGEAANLLKTAQAKLEKLRSTPARIELFKSIAALESRIKEENS
ncbi:tetratricopeptide repeat protein [Sediminihaliea albiluteola]|nr:hypothetical protein [Sediminihaliea albiluteola]